MPPEIATFSITAVTDISAAPMIWKASPSPAPSSIVVCPATPSIINISIDSISRADIAK